MVLGGGLMNFVIIKFEIWKNIIEKMIIKKVFFWLILLELMFVSFVLFFVEVIVYDMLVDDICVFYVKKLCLKLCVLFK